MVKALKISWVKRLLSPNKLNCKPKRKISMSDMNDISKFTCKLGTDQIPGNKSKFYKQILEFSFDIFSVELSSTGEILNEKLLFNKLILFHRKPIGENFTLRRKTGISCIGQLVKENSFKTLQELEQEYNCSLSQLQLNSLLSAIPPSWRKMLKNNTSPIIYPPN